MLKGPEREGVYGKNSRLFFEYARVLDELEEIVGKDKIWFLFENVASMKGKECFLCYI